MKTFAIHLLLFCSLGAVLLLTACQHAVTRAQFDPLNDISSGTGSADFESIEAVRTLNPELLKPSKAPYQLGVGDRIEIEISGISGSRSETFIMPDGRVYYDLAGGVKADGLTIKNLSDRLEVALSRDYTSPQVNVTLREVRSRRVWLMGRVNSPGLYPLSQPTTLLEAISLAGGLFTSRFSGSTEELADLSNSFVLRDGKMLPINLLNLIKQGDMSQNIYLEDGDYVYLPSSLSQNLQVLGAVIQPQSIGFKDQMTLVAAIARAQGPSPDAYLSKVLIIRGSKSEPKVAEVDLKAILSGNAPNIELRPFDIIWVPDSPYRLLKKYFWVVMDSAATTIAVREGANSVETDADKPAVVIPIGL